MPVRCLICLIVLLPAVIVRAEQVLSNPTVLVLQPDADTEFAWPEATARLKNELLLSGFEVLEREDEPADAIPVSLMMDKMVKFAGASVGFRIVRVAGTDTVVLSVLTATVEKPSEFRELLIDAEIEDAALEVISIRAVEAVRAFLAAHSSDDDTAAASETPMPAPVPLVENSALENEALPLLPPIETSLPRLELTFKLLGEGAPGGIGPLGGLGVGILFRPSGRFAVGLDSTVSLLGKDIEHGSSASTFDLLIARVIAAYIFKGIDILVPSVGVAVGIAHIWTQGTSDVTDDVKTDRVTLFYGGAFVELALRDS